MVEKTKNITPEQQTKADLLEIKLYDSTSHAGMYYVFREGRGNLASDITRKIKPFGAWDLFYDTPEQIFETLGNMKKYNGKWTK